MVGRPLPGAALERAKRVNGACTVSGMSGHPAGGRAAAPAAAGNSPIRMRASWTALVVGSVALLLLVAAALATSHGLTTRTEIASYLARGTPERIVLTLRSGNAEVVGGARGAVEVRRTARYSYGHRPTERRSATDGQLRIASGCPSVLFGGCTASYRLTIPDNVPVTVRTAGGTVRLAGIRGSAQIESGAGDVDVDTFCGFSLSIQTTSGHARTTASCSPQRLEMSSASGDLNATVPVGSYRIEAESERGAREVTDLEGSSQAPFEIRMISESGDVTAGGGA
jgi:Putative adhesin